MKRRVKAFRCPATLRKRFATLVTAKVKHRPLLPAPPVAQRHARAGRRRTPARHRQTQRGPGHPRTRRRRSRRGQQGTRRGQRRAPRRQAHARAGQRETSVAARDPRRGARAPRSCAARAAYGTPSALACSAHTRSGPPRGRCGAALPLTCPGVARDRMGRGQGVTQTQRPDMRYAQHRRTREHRGADWQCAPPRQGNPRRPEQRKTRHGRFARAASPGLAQHYHAGHRAKRNGARPQG